MERDSLLNKKSSLMKFILKIHGQLLRLREHVEDILYGRNVPANMTIHNLISTCHVRVDHVPPLRSRIFSASKQAWEKMQEHQLDVFLVN